MQHSLPENQAAVSRRQFLRTSTLAAASVTAALSMPSLALGQEKKTFNAVIIGAGGRGTGAGGNFLQACNEVGVTGKIVAVADVFPEAAAKAAQEFKVPQDKTFSGFDAFEKALAVAGVNYAILASPPGFRPAHFQAAIRAGKNVFLEKPVAVDGPGCQIMYAAYEEAKKKNLKVAAGTQRRHKPSYVQTLERIHAGDIGDITSLRAYWVNTGPIWHRGDNGNTPLERQVRNWYHYIWLCGDHICEQHVHDIDVCNWAMKNQHPVRAWGMGGRQQLEGKSGEIWDNFAVEFVYENGVRMHSYCGQIKRSWGSVSEAVHGTAGTAEMFDGRNFVRPKNGKVWRPGEIKNDNGYHWEHVDLLKAIIEDKDLNEAKQVTDSTMTAIMGREAAYCGSEVTWEDIANSKFRYGPDLLYTDAAKMTWGEFRTLRPPMPSRFKTIGDHPEIELA